MLKNPQSPSVPQDILNTLMQRDRLQAALDDRQAISAEQLIQLADLDTRLRAQADKIAACLEVKTWRQTIEPAETAWWWFLEATPPKRWWNRYDWLLNTGTIVSLTISASLITDMASRLFAGGIDVGSTLVIAGQSLLTLLAGGGALTAAGRKAYERILRSLNLNQYYWQEVSLGAAFVLTLILVGVHGSLPQLALRVNRSGEENYQLGKLALAQKDYEKAIALKPSYSEAYFNLGQVYEDLQDFQQAKKQYQWVVNSTPEVCEQNTEAVCGDLIWLLTHNNLARLYILENNYEASAPLLQRALRQLEQAQIETDAETQRLKYDLLKNLGWVRLNQKFYIDATNYLKQAIHLDAQSPDAYCLYAQLLDETAQPQAARTEWEKCLTQAYQEPIALETQPEVNKWAAIAQEKLSSSEEQP